MGGALVFEVRSAAAPQRILKIRLTGPTARVIAGGVKPKLEKPYSLQTFNPTPVNPSPKPCTSKKTENCTILIIFRPVEILGLRENVRISGHFFF